TTSTWAATASMSSARLNHRAALLSDGRVIVINGTSTGSPSGNLATVEIWSPGTGSWAPSASTSVARSNFSATLLGDGRVLAAGGISQTGQALGSAEIWTNR